MSLANGLVERARNGRRSIEITAPYIEHVRIVLVRHDAVAPNPCTEPTEARREVSSCGGFPGLPDHLYRVAVVVVNLESHLLVVTVLLAQVEEPVRFRCPQAKSATDLK